MNNDTNNFDVWDNDAPALKINGDLSFTLWDNGAPLIDGFDLTPEPSVIRRRLPFIF